MRRSRVVWAAVAAALSLLGTAVPQASTVMQMNLGEMVQRADRIYRGTVLSASATTVAVGGGQLPVSVYQLRVEESFRGDFTEVKGVRIAEIRTLGKLRSTTQGTLRSAVILPRMPELQIGRTYLVLTTQPGAIGLSTTVGLGQGVFRISQVGKDEQAINEANNSGLFRDMPAPAAQGFARSSTRADAGGAVSYADLASRIRGLVR